jgi:hypothetical protein
VPSHAMTKLPTTFTLQPKPTRLPSSLLLLRC